MDIPGLSDVLTSAGNIWYLWVGLALIPSIIMGIFTAKLAKKKGYHGYFFTGFFHHIFNSDRVDTTIINKFF